MARAETEESPTAGWHVIPPMRPSFQTSQASPPNRREAHVVLIGGKYGLPFRHPKRVLINQ